MNFTNKNAIFSPDRKYRYVLSREWMPNKPKLAFIGLNPSTANEFTNDNTIIKCAKIAAFNGFGSFYMLNLFAFVTAYPNELLQCADAINKNDEYLYNFGNECEKIVCCWGAFKEAKNRAQEVLEQLHKPYCLKINADGSPKHPLYCPDKTAIIEYLN